MLVARYLLDVLIDSKWMFSLAPKDSGSVANISEGKHKLELAIAGMSTKKRMSYDFEFNGAPLLIELPNTKPNIIIKTRKQSSKGKSIDDKEKYFQPVFDNSIASVPNTNTAFDIENPVFKKRIPNIPIYNYTNILFDIPFYFIELPADATGKIKFNIGLETINNFKSFNGLFWGIGYSFYLMGYTQHTQYLSGAYIYSNGGYDATYYTRTEMPFAYYGFNFGGSFGYLYEPNDFIGLYSSVRIIPSLSYTSSYSLQPYSNQTTTMTEYGAKKIDNSEFKVNFGASINIGAMFYPFGENSTYGIFTEGLLYLGGGVNVGFNLGLSARVLGKMDQRYRYYQ